MGKRLSGEGSFRERANGTWEGRVRWTADDGQGKRLSVYGATQSEVRTKVGEVLRRLRRGEPVRDTERTLAVWATEWLSESLPVSGRRASTIDAYSSLTRTHIVPKLGAHKLSALRPTHVEKFLGQLSKELRPSTVRQAYSVLRAILQGAVRDGLIAKNVTLAVTRPVVPMSDPRPVSQKQVRELIASANGHRLRPLLVLVATTGLRRGEALGLRWGDIDLQAGSLRVSRSLVRTSKGIEMDNQTKTPRGRRTIPLAQSVVVELRDHKARQAGERLKAGPAWRNLDLVFCTEDGGPLEPRNVSRWYAGLTLLCGVEDRGMHALRHYAATAMLESGSTVRTVADVLGHSDVSITLNVYASSRDDSQRQAIDGLASGLGL